MSEVPKRLKPTYETFRELYLKSGNLCAFPGCNALIIDEESNFIAQLCHIEAAEPGGARFNPAMTNEERRSAANLMLMCYPHHQITNNEERYSVSDLKAMKAAHEHRFSGSDRATRERLAKLKWASLVSAGVVAGVGIDEIAHRIKSALSSFIESPDSRQLTPLRKELQQRLRYAPTGVIYCHARDALHSAVGEQFLEIFEAAGWQIERLQNYPPFLGRELLDFERSMLMMFVISEVSQLSNTRQAIDDFFSKAGFLLGTSKEDPMREQREYGITFYVPVMVRPK